MRTLILLRHGESAWNSRNLFTGWIDVDLTERGERQARDSGRALLAAGMLPQTVHTSVLTRAVRTATLTMEAAGRAWVPVARHWRLNERHYGALQGREKSGARREFGAERFDQWRRSYDAAPPPVQRDSAGDVARDPRYAQLPRELLPRTESLADVTARLLPYWYDAVVPDLLAGRTVLVVAHSNSLRALVAHLDRLNPHELLDLNIPTGMPLAYDLGGDLAPRVRGGHYLDPRAAAAAAAEVADQGRSRLGTTR